VSTFVRIVAFGAALIVAAPASAAQTSTAHPPKKAEAQAPAKRPPSQHDGARDRAGDIVTQPARDVGVSRKEIPPPLVKATQNPYSLAGLKNCRQIAAAVAELNEVLGADYDGAAEFRENRMAKLAEAGGKTVVNSLIPFRSLVREVSGAAPADRRLRSAINAGFARRGYLRGVYATRGCRAKI
jgi:hypothetical protein